nr:reverse transcriptase domain-containing protein [Tanacetum cinerariifolium]
MIKITKREYSKPLQTRQHQSRMSSNQVLKRLLKTSTLGEIVSLEKSNKNVIGLKNIIDLPVNFNLGSDFILEEIKAYLKDDLILPEIDLADCDPEEDICLIEKLLNDDPFQLLSMDLKKGELTKKKSSVEEPPKLELKDLPSHLEYANLDGADKLPVIITKDLKDDEKEALLKVLKSHNGSLLGKSPTSRVLTLVFVLTTS